MESYSNLFKKAIENINSNNTTQLIASLQLCLEELELQNSYLLETYENSYIDHYDALKCFPLCEFVIKKIMSNFINEHKKSLIY